MQGLSDQEILVLFEFCHRLCETDKVAASHHAEIVVLGKIAGLLERSLVEPFMENYKDLLASARNAVLNNYRESMGENGWVESVQLEQL